MLQMQYTVKTMDISLALAVESISYHKRLIVYNKCASLKNSVMGSLLDFNYQCKKTKKNRYIYEHILFASKKCYCSMPFNAQNIQ